MNCEVQHLAENIRYRILIINGEHYILDMERSFLKIIFPFFFWLLPSPVFKVEDQAVMEKLNVEKKEKVNSGQIIMWGGIAVVLGQFLTPLMDYFEVQSSFFVNSILSIIALILVTLLYLSISHKRKKNLIDIMECNPLQQSIIRIRPKSTKHIFKAIMIYTWALGLVLSGFVMYIDSGNILILIIGSGFYFALLVINRISVEEGYTTVRFID
ncbi:DUF443 family protein [Oceanobacillus jeddahense]|uniref:DUF443 family protein n=1 Tax=Oceanobacillus jeddahense TaxID=1462527 RepID=UPI000595B25C|nr:DUF443 family protein [Oceanobacillus jeddahense]